MYLDVQCTFVRNETPSRTSTLETLRENKFCATNCVESIRNPVNKSLTNNGIKFLPPCKNCALLYIPLFVRLLETINFYRNSTPEFRN